MPNVHLAHHPTLSIHSLHDHVHLRKDIVKVFAKTLKDVALGRSQGGASVSRGRASQHITGPPLSPPAREYRRYPLGSGPYPPPPLLPHLQSHPPRTSAIQARQASTTPINSRPIPGYQPCPPFQQPAQKSYATALKTPPNIGRDGADLGEITHLLSLICTKLMSQVV
ncbi:Replication protein A 70 kDa DNA-binding subunit A [Dissostichus eleginoides]|uniref:Replication protein A 70 kDa DNA-binding subunit A n=1 Tax=Dissostichus eleginoides TaxID=100907 RepID=A0AAD9B2V3_DISEL|nr:Replication protein A 70 kDa DNA-binding subunit A [Dissostichus eleginoides]